MPAGQRRLAAIVAADVASYSRLMGADEEGTIAALRAHREAVFDPKLAQYNGRIANTAGDSLLIEFPSAVDALRCAVDIQQSMAMRNRDVPEDRRLVFRIGINVGDVVANGDDLLGDGVNVAARIEALAPAGGICLSRSARDQVRDRVEIALEDLGEVAVKNIARPVRVFRVLAEGEEAGASAPRAGFRGPVARWGTALIGLAVLAGGLVWWQQHETPIDAPDGVVQAVAGKPSIAVLPFANLSDDRTQAYFADGITEDIVTDLSRVAGLYVTSRSATLRYRDKGSDPRRVAEELGVAHILEGSVRRAGDKVRITATLIDGATGGPRWSQRFDRDTQDVFAIQDEIARHVVARLSEMLKGTALKPVKRSYTPVLAAYDLYIQGRAKRIPPTPGNLAAALAMFEKAIEIDPKFAGGYAGAAFVNILRYDNSPAPLPGALKNLDTASRYAEKAVALDPSFGPGWGNLAETHIRKRRFSEALDAARTAIRAAPNDSLMRASYGKYLGYAGRAEEGIEQVKQATRMSPDSLPLLYFLGANYRAAGKLAEAIEALTEHRERLGGRVLPAPTSQLIAALAQAGRLDAARAEVAAVLKMVPHFRVDLATRNHVYARPEDMKRYADALIAAGVPR